MLGFVSGLLGDAIAPLVSAAAEAGGRLLRKAALFLLAAFALLVMLIALTTAFDLWIASLAGPIVGALAVAGLYLLVAVIAVVVAVRDAPKQQPAAAEEAPPGPASKNPDLGDQVDRVTAPLIALLQRFGLRREQLAVFAGATIAKRLGPLPLVGCAIVVGFLVGRLWKSWGRVFETVLAVAPFAADLFGQKSDPAASADPPVAG